MTAAVFKVFLHRVLLAGDVAIIEVAKIMTDPSTVQSVVCRVTAQRSQEDAEEVERERRRRSREKERGEKSPSWSENPVQDELDYTTQ